MTESKEAAPPKNKNYFNQGTEDAIVKFQQETDMQVRNAIYVEHIQPAFDKLAENIINVYGFHSLGEVSALRTDCVSMLFENLYKFNSTKGHKAFSYYNVIAKNWFIQRGKVQKKRSKADIAMTRDVLNYLEKTKDNMLVQSSELQAMDGEFYELLMEDIKHWDAKFSKPQEQAVLNAMRMLFENPDMPALFSKKGVYLYLREITDLNTKQIVVNLTKFRRRYNAFKKRYMEGKI